jgi:type I restriction enzyme S subunit
MSAEWPTVEIDQVCALIVDCVNKTAPIVGQATPYRMIRTTNIRNGRIDLSSCRYVDEATYTKWTRRASLQHGDVLLTREAPIGEVGLVDTPEGLFLGQRVMQYRADPLVLSPRFLLYTFLSPALQDQFGSHEGSGSVVSHIRVGDCFKFKVKLPPLPVQTEIAALLGALDDRITLLRETNAMLEAIAQALFKSWFVDFDPVRAKMEGRIPEGMDEATAALFPDGFEASELGLVPRGWHVAPMTSIADIVMGLSPKGESYNFDGLGVPLVNGPVEFGDYFPVKTKWTTSPDRLTVSGDLIFCVRGSTTGRRVVSDGIYCIGRGVCAIRAANGHDGFLYQTINFGIDRLLSKTTGSVFPSLSGPDIKNFLVLNPADGIASAYEDLTRPLLGRIQENHEQAQTLATLRDALLPRLISGQLRLPEAQAAAEEALV